MIRYATLNDIDRNLLNLYVNGFKMHFSARPDFFPVKSDDDLRNNLIEMINNKDEYIIVYEDNDIIKGFLAYQIRDKRYKSIWIDELYVSDNSRKLGIGKLLMNEVTKISIQEKCNSIELNCWCFNENAIKFYEKLGYTRQRIIFEKVNK